jgi:hypothetical protein
MSTLVPTCEQALEEWINLGCAQYGQLCDGLLCPPKKKKCGEPGAKPCPPQVPNIPIIPVVPIVPSCGGPGNPCICTGPECCPDGSPPPCNCPDGSQPPCVTVVCQNVCQDGSTPTPPDCNCPDTCADGTPPPCPVILCAPCPNGKTPAAPACNCPCPPGEHAPPCLEGEAPDLNSGCCQPLISPCGPGTHAQPCASGESLDPMTGCCNYDSVFFCIGRNPNNFHGCGICGASTVDGWPAVLANINKNEGGLCYGPVFGDGTPFGGGTSG